MRTPRWQVSAYRYRRIEMLLTLSEVKSRNARMLARLRKLGVEIKNTQGLEALAAIENFSDWNKFEAHLQKQVQNIAAHKEEMHPQPPRFICLSPGSGKSAVLELLMVDCASKGNFVICFDFSGNGFRGMPPDYTSLVEVIPVTWSDVGDLRVGQLHPKTDRPIKLFAFTTETHFGSVDYRGKVFADLVKQITENWSRDVLGHLGLVVVDEFHRVRDGRHDVIHVSLPLLHGLGPTLVVGSQVFPLDLKNSVLAWRVITTKDIDSHADAHSVLDGISHVFLEDCVNLPPSFADDSVLIEAFAVYTYMKLRRKAFNFQFGRHTNMIQIFSNEWQAVRKRNSAPANPADVLDPRRHKD